ncbi:MAG: GNAT family N-acetyltransferase [Chloroflexota bacterium]
MNNLSAQRDAIASLLAPSAPEDAQAAYYALYHDPRRTELTLYRTPDDRATGFIAVCQTGQDLFRPLVVMRAPDAHAATDLLLRALIPGRPYFFLAPANLVAGVQDVLEMSSPSVQRILLVDPSRFALLQTVRINVLVQENHGPEGQPRWEIRSGGQPAAVAGTNWRSPFCAEVFVFTAPEFQGRGWGQAVVRAATLGLLHEGLLPLYIVDEDNLPSIQLAEAVGYRDSGHRMVAAEVRVRLG